MVLDNWSPLITSVTRIDSKSAHPCSYEFAKTNNRCHITVHNLKESVAMNCNGCSTTLVFLRLSRAASSSKPSNVNGGGHGRWPGPTKLVQPCNLPLQPRPSRVRLAAPPPSALAATTTQCCIPWLLRYPRGDAHSLRN